MPSRRKKRQRKKVTLTCSKCGYVEQHGGENMLSLYHYAIHKFGWSIYALDVWLCQVCYEKVPKRETT